MNANRALLTFIGLVLCCTACLAQAPASDAKPATSTETPSTGSAGVVIPLITYQEVALTTAIEALARQAGLNYILDPKVPYGQPDATGKPTPQPTITIRWENRTAEQALNALLNTYGLQLVDDAKTRISKITVKDPAAPEPLVTHIVQLKYTGVTNLLSAVQATFTEKRSKVIGDARSSQLVIVCTEKEIAPVDELINRLDTPTRQVLIEAQIMEISRNPSSVKGIDWSGTLQAQNLTFGNGIATATTGTTPGSTTTTVDPGGRVITTTVPGSSGTQVSAVSGAGNNGFSLNTLKGLTPNIGFLNADGVKATLSFLNQDADTQVISTPRAVTLDNETATLSVTRAVPIFKSTAGTQGSPGGSEVQYTNLGTILTVTPRISANDFIWLKVIPEVSSIFTTVQKISAGQVNQADIYDIRKIETQVLIPSGNTLVMGGLMSDSTKNSYTKVPILGDVPIVGRAFSHQDKSRDKRNLLIFVTPTVVRETDFQTANNKSFLKSRPTVIQGGIDTKSSYNSAKRKDWSNPEATPIDEAEFDEGAWADPAPATSKP